MFPFYWILDCHIIKCLPFFIYFTYVNNRFRLSLNVGDFDNEASFIMRDDVVRQLAPSTYKLLVDTVIILSYFLVFSLFLSNI